MYFVLCLLLLGPCLALQQYQYFNDYLILKDVGHDSTFMNFTTLGRTEILFTSNITVQDYILKLKILNLKDRYTTELLDHEDKILQTTHKRNIKDDTVMMRWDDEKLNLHMGDRSVFEYIDRAKFSQVQHIAMLPLIESSITINKTFIFYGRTEHICLENEHTHLTCDLKLPASKSVMTVPEDVVDLMRIDLYKSSSANNYTLHIDANTLTADPEFKDVDGVSRNNPLTTLHIDKNGVEQLKGTAHFFQGESINTRVDFNASTLIINREEGHKYFYNLLWEERDTHFNFNLLNRIIIQVRNPPENSNNCQVHCLKQPGFFKRFFGFGKHKNQQEYC